MAVTVASPKGYEVAPEFIQLARSLGGNVVTASSPAEAVKDAHVIVTDTWISMGDEAEGKTACRLPRVHGKRQTPQTCSPGCPGTSLPAAHRGEEITGDILDGPQSLVWDEAENRLHAQKALLVKLLKK